MISAPYLLLAKIGAVGALLVAVFFYGHHVGANGVQAAWDVSKAQMISVQDQLIAKNEKDIAAITAKQQANNLKVSQDHERELSEIQKQYDTDLAAVRASGGLRVSRSICSGPVATTAEADGDSGHNETATATVELPDEITADLFSEANRADEIVEQARSCQAWIISNGFYGASTPQKQVSESKPN